MRRRRADGNACILDSTLGYAAGAAGAMCLAAGALLEMDPVLRVGLLALGAALAAWCRAASCMYALRRIEDRLDDVERVLDRLCDERATEAYRVAHRERWPR